MAGGTIRFELGDTDLPNTTSAVGSMGATMVSSAVHNAATTLRNELIALIRSKAPGAKIQIKYERDKQEHTATLVVTADAPTPTPS